jgi:hypothetical protein
MTKPVILLLDKNREIDEKGDTSLMPSNHPTLLIKIDFITYSLPKP